MITSNNYLTVQINYLPFWEKPPLFIWMQVISMKMFGVNEFAARFPNAVCGIVTLLLLFNIGKKIYNTNFGLIWTMVYCCSMLSFFYFKSGIIDPWFNLFIFVGIYFFIEYSIKEKTKLLNVNIVLSAAFIGLAIMTKGPVALLVFILTCFAYLIFSRFNLKIRIIDIITFIIVLSLVGGLWFIIQIANGQYQLVYDFIIYQIRLLTTEDAGHGGFFGYHFAVIFFGVFPASLFALKSFKSYNDNDSDYQKTFKKWMIILFFVVLILFSIVNTKIIHYSSLCYYPLTFLAALFIFKVLNNEAKFNKWLLYLIVAIGVIWSVVLVSLQFINQYKESIIKSGYINDVFAIENLKANVYWSGYEFIIGLLLLLGLIISIIYYKKNMMYQSIVAILVSSLVFTFLTMLFIIPKVEQYSQNAAIEFYKQRKNEDCYVENLGFKSYADLFYTEKKYLLNQNTSIDSLLRGKIDKPAYFVTKITKKDDYLGKFDLNLIYEKNGFVFFERNP